MASPNTGALPLIFIGALKEAFVSEAKQTGDTTDYEKVFEQAVGFIMLNACIQTILRWSIAYDMMRKPKELEDNSSDSQDLESRNDKHHQSEFWLKFWNIINPTLVASIVAICIASVPSLKALFYQKNAVAPLYHVVFEPIYMIGQNSKSILTLQLGFNLAMILDGDLKEQKELLTKWHYTLNMLLKCVLYPFIAFGIVMPLFWAGFMRDEMQSFIAMLQIASPSAITLTVITNLHKYLERETAMCYIYQYAVSVVTLTLSSAFFLKVLF